MKASKTVAETKMTSQIATGGRTNDPSETDVSHQPVDPRKLLPLLIIVAPAVWAIMAAVAYVGVRLVR